MLKFVFALFFVFAVSGGAHCVDLRGNTAVHITSDTAANAKNMAVDEAQRQIIFDVLKPYADANVLQEQIKKAKTSDLTNLIASSSIDGEKSSDTVYSANFSMVVDGEAARKWLDSLEIQNWLPNVQNQNTFFVRVNLTDKVADWTALNSIANAEKINLNLKNMTGNVLTLELPQSVRGSFTIVLREKGWKYADNEGVLVIYK